MTTEHESNDTKQQEEEEEEKKSDQDEVQFIATNKNLVQEQEDDKNVKTNGDNLSQKRSRDDTNAPKMGDKRLVSAPKMMLETEIQCIICQYTMFKPITAMCGHSFCRVCLLDSLLMRSIEEAHCPICRVEILQPFFANSSLASVFSINVTLWNLSQLLIPSVAERILSYHQEEEKIYLNKLDQLDSKWKVFTLSKRAARYHGDELQEDESLLDRSEEDDGGHDEYPVLKVEDTRDEFPSIFELYNEHQECSVNVIKMEEDEEMTDGMPFFMNDDGDDDGFVCSSYYNEISLRVCDEADNCVMERTRGAQSGVVTFPGLRLDVPGGMYTFHFADDLYGLKLSIATRLREPHEVSDTPVADFVSLIHGEARDAGRRNRDTHHDSDSEREFDGEENELDNLFIVDDCVSDEHNEQPIARFLNGNGQDDIEHHSNDEAADEEREQWRARRWPHRSRRSERDIKVVEAYHADGAFSSEEDEHFDGQDTVDKHDEGEEVDGEVRSERCNDRSVEGHFSSDEDADHKEHDTVKQSQKDQRCRRDAICSRQQNANRIVDSNDEDEDENAPVDSEEKQKVDNVSAGAQNDHDEERLQRGCGSASPSIALKDHHREEEGTVALNLNKKVNRAQWFQDEKFDEGDKVTCSDAADEVTERRPWKRSRKVRIITEGESDEEQENMERSVLSTSTVHTYDDDDDDVDDDREVNEDDDEDVDEENTSDARFRRMHLLFDEEDEESADSDNVEHEEDDGLELDDDDDDDDE
ncbi:unnamed protein product [Peronospora belbahrii]|uniref:RING-type domain-containing protein n=1 Tax=Peronospora belbahrii TaxID=622444 RepID=A0AAU9KYQ9_9STRA|nr:unnamed protein product [Peronospora belbahrii]